MGHNKVLNSLDKEILRLYNLGLCDSQISKEIYGDIAQYGAIALWRHGMGLAKNTYRKANNNKINKTAYKAKNAESIVEISIKCREQGISYGAYQARKYDAERFFSARIKASCAFAMNQRTESG